MRGVCKAWARAPGATASQTANAGLQPTQRSYDKTRPLPLPLPRRCHAAPPRPGPPRPAPPPPKGHHQVELLGQRGAHDAAAHRLAKQHKRKLAAGRQQQAAAGGAARGGGGSVDSRGREAGGAAGGRAGRGRIAQAFPQSGMASAARRSCAPTCVPTAPG